jgi:protein involved in polysaccharide export with SLBB domain
MNYLRNFGKATMATVVLLGMLWLTGCGTSTPVYQDYNGDGAARRAVNIFHPGDEVVISYAAPELDKKEHKERVKEDGTITPPEIGDLKAAGKTAGELQKELQDRYNRIYVNLTVTVNPGDRFYYVDGEVKMNGPKTYLSETDVVKAIAAGGGFTEYANRKRISLIHPDGKTEYVNYNKAIEDPAYNPPVYPGDKVVVKRRRF